MPPATARQPVRLAAVALPPEHGGWGFVAESLTLTLLATPLPAALPLGVVTVAGFLGYQPLRLWLDDRLRGRAVPRTRFAAALALGAGSVVAVALLAALARSPSRRGLVAPLVITGLLLAAGLVLALRGRSRSLAAELLGASAPGGVAAASAAGQDLSVAVALGLWGLLLGRGLPAVLLVRARLRRDRGQATSPAACHVAHGAVALVAVALAWWGFPTGAVAAIFALLWARAIVLLWWPRPLRPQVVGVTELVLGLAAVTALALTLPRLG